MKFDIKKVGFIRPTRIFSIIQLSNFRATMPDPDLVIRDNAYWLWFAVWNWDYIVVNGTKELSDAYTSFQMMEKVYNSEVMITREELPDFSQYDDKEN